MGSILNEELTEMGQNEGGIKIEADFLDTIEPTHTRL